MLPLKVVQVQPSVLENQGSRLIKNISLPIQDN